MEITKRSHRVYNLRQMKIRNSENSKPKKPFFPQKGLLGSQARYACSNFQWILLSKEIVHDVC